MKKLYSAEIKVETMELKLVLIRFYQCINNNYNGSATTMKLLPVHLHILYSHQNSKTLYCCTFCASRHDILLAYSTGGIPFQRINGLQPVDKQKFQSKKCARFNYWSFIKITVSYFQHRHFICLLHDLRLNNRLTNRYTVTENTIWYHHSGINPFTFIVFFFFLLLIF